MLLEFGYRLVPATWYPVYPSSVHQVTPFEWVDGLAPSILFLNGVSGFFDFDCVIVRPRKNSLLLAIGFFTVLCTERIIFRKVRLLIGIFYIYFCDIELGSSTSVWLTFKEVGFKYFCHSQILTTYHYNEPVFCYFKMLLSSRISTGKSVTHGNLITALSKIILMNAFFFLKLIIVFSKYLTIVHFLFLCLFPCTCWQRSTTQAIGLLWSFQIALSYFDRRI